MSVVTLSHPLRVLKDDVAELTFREPTGADLVKCGYPMRFNGDGMTEVVTPAMSKMIAALAGIPPVSVERLSVPDWNACMTVVMDFFGAPTATSSTDTSRPPAGGATS